MMTSRKALHLVYILLGSGLLVLLFTSMAAAQPDTAGGGDAVPLNPAEWFTTSAVLGGVVMAWVGLLKTLLPDTIKGFVTLIVAFASSVGLAIIGNVVGWLPGSFLNAIIFGVSAGMLATGLKATANSVAAKAGTLPR